MQDASDAALWTAWRGGDVRAGDALFRHHYPAIYRFFAGKARHDVEDLVHRTFLACVEGTHAGRDVASFRAWLLGIARHVLYHAWRDEKEFDPARSSLADLTPSPAEVVGEAEEQRMLARALRRLPLDDQIILELHYWEGLASAELGVVLGIPSPTARGRLQRARAALRRILERLPGDDRVRASTLADLGRWIASMRAQLEPPHER